MFKLKTILAASATAMIAVSASAGAQPAGKFQAKEAAYCTATFGWVLQVLAPNGLPPQAAQEAEVAFMMWNYELNAATPDASEQQMKSMADNAIAELTSKFPPAQGPEDAQKVVNFVSGEASECGRKLETAYPSGKHPVLAALRQQAQAKAAAAQKQKPATAPVKKAATAPTPASATTQAPQQPQQPAMVMPPDSALPLGVGTGGSLPLVGGSPLASSSEPQALEPVPLESLTLEELAASDE